ncbi:MAG: hypothetical protein FWD94_06205 [Treponema sp.]|nr:hypothetical protein [Treponema sp.]
MGNATPNGTTIPRGIIDAEIDMITERFENIKKLFGKKHDLEPYQTITGTIDTLKQTGTGDNPGSGIIYTLHAINFPFDRVETEEKFAVWKQEFSLCRINKSKNWETAKTGTVCMYVGSSEDISTRLKQHLFTHNPTTYAMHLETWLPKDVTIRIDLWNFGDLLDEFKDKEERADYVQCIEDVLWNHLRPLFGRQGRK